MQAWLVLLPGDVFVRVFWPCLLTGESVCFQPAPQDQQVLAEVRRTSVGLGGSMFYVLKVFFTSIICLLLRGGKAPQILLSVLPAQPNFLRVQHYALPHASILFYICKLK